MRRNRIRALLAGTAAGMTVVVLAPPAVSGATGPTSSGAAVSTTFTAPGIATYAVPAGTCMVRIDAVGGAGATPPPGAGGLPVSNPGGKGGAGGEISASIPVLGGEVLQVRVAGRGVESTGGFGGGGNSTPSGSASFVGGGAGGGASDVRRGGTALSNRVIVAGGGGGGSAIGGSEHYDDNYGQSDFFYVAPVAGGPAGAAGEAGRFGVFFGIDTGSHPKPPTLEPGSGGGGAGATGPGKAGAVPFHADQWGKPGALGAGADSTIIAAGAGGGGYYGGGSGSGPDEISYFWVNQATQSAIHVDQWRTAAGGGGGSSWAEPDSADVVTGPTTNTGDGRVTITPFVSQRRCDVAPVTTPTTAAPATTAPGALLITAVSDTTAALPTASAAVPVAGQPQFTG